MKDGYIKNSLRKAVTVLNKGRHDRYLNNMKSRGKDLPEFTLYTSDCIGGLIYHSLNRAFLSPTINMSIRDKEFLKFVANPNYYYQQRICFTQEDTYPVGYLGSEDARIQIRFEHYETESEASEKWNARKQRVCENVFVIMADQDLDDGEIERFKELRCKRKIMFTWNPARADGLEIFHIKSYGKSCIKRYSRLNKDGFRDYERFFDYVSWLDMKEDFMMDPDD